MLLHLSTWGHITQDENITILIVTFLPKYLIGKGKGVPRQAEVAQGVPVG
jgi:hypothetical protein